MASSESAATPAPVISRSLGIWLLLAAGFSFSTAGVFIRQVGQGTDWQVMLYRSLTFSLGVLLFVIIRHRARTFAAFRAIGLSGVIGALGLGVGALFFVWAQFHTTVANVVFILGSLPFLCGLAAWAIMGEQVARASWLAMALALAGIGTMVYDGIASDRLYGNLLALVAILGFVVFTLLLRRGRHGDTAPILVLGAGLAALAALIVRGGDFAIAPMDLLWSSLMGAGSMAVGFILFGYGAKAVRAGEMWLLSNVEIATGPFLVWLAVGELPTALTFYGGGLIAVAIVIQALIAGRDQRASQTR